MKKYKVVVLFGKCAAGKDIIQNWLIDESPNIKKIVSCTTRPPRDYEVDGVDYHFLNVEEFGIKVLNGSMLEAVEFQGNFYGAAIDELDIDKINIGAFELDGVHALLKDSRLDVLCIYIDATDKTRMLRSLNREQSPDVAKLCKRFLKENEDFDFENFDFNCMIYDNDKNMEDLDFSKLLSVINAFGQE